MSLAAGTRLGTYEIVAPLGAGWREKARTVAGLNHPNIVTLHSVEDIDGIRFLTMELVEGQSLADRGAGVSTVECRGTFARA